MRNVAEAEQERADSIGAQGDPSIHRPRCLARAPLRQIYISTRLTWIPERH